MNNCVRFELRKRRGEHISGPWHDLGWLSPYNRRFYLLGCIVYCMLMLNKNALLCERIRMNHNDARHRYNNEIDTLIAPIPRTSTLQYSFLVVGTSF